MSDTTIQLDIAYLQKVLPEYFGEMNAEQFDEISHSIEWLRIERGDLLFNAGDPGDSMYILISGRLQVFSGPDNKSKKILGFIMHGESVGEMALITNENRSATVKAMRSSILIKLSREAFNRLVSLRPALLMSVARDVIFRLRRINRQEGGFFTPKNILFIETDPDVRIAEFIDAFISEVKPFATSRIVSPGSLKQTITDYSQEGLNEILSTLNKVEKRYDHVFFHCPYANYNWIKMTGLIADKVYLVSSFKRGPELNEFEEKVFNHFDNEYAPIDLLFLHEPGTEPIGTETYLKKRKYTRFYHLRHGAKKDYTRLARMLTGNALSLVLGGGGARGYAHLGVLKAFEEHNIPVDLIGGTSVGSSMAIGSALDYPVAKQIDLSLKFNSAKPFNDIRFPLISLLRGRRMDKVLRTIFGEKHIEDTWLPFFAVASNLNKTRADFIRSGKIWRAIRASMSLPAVLPPVIRGDSLLVDGGIFNNLPIDEMRRTLKCKVIGVNVGSSQDTTVDFETFPSTFRLIADKLLGRNKWASLPNFFSIILKLTTIASASKLEQDIQNADIVLTPPVSDYNMLDIERIHDIIEVGYNYTIPLIPEIKRKLNLTE